MPLTDIKVRAAKPKEKAYKLSDSVWRSIFANWPSGLQILAFKISISGQGKVIGHWGVPRDITWRGSRKKRPGQKTDSKWC